jgi:hypothetical protein
MVRVVKRARLRLTIAVEGVVAVVARGVRMIEVYAIRAAVAAQAHLLRGLERVEVGRREVIVVASVDLALGSEWRAQMDLVPPVARIGQRVGVVTADAGNVLLALAEHACGSPLSPVGEGPALVGRVAVGAEGVVRLEAHADDVGVAIPGLYEIVGVVQIVFRQDLAGGSVAVAADPGRSVHHDVLRLERLGVRRSGAVAGLVRLRRSR